MDFSVSSKLESRGFNTTEIFRLLLHRSWGVKNCQQGRRIEKTAISPLSPDILCLRSSSCYQCVSFLSFPSPSLGPYSSSLILFSSLSPWYFLKCSVYVQQKERYMWPLLLHSWLWTLEIQVRMKIISISETAHRKKNAEPCTWYHWHQIYLEIQTVKFHRSKARWEQALHCTQVSAASQQCDSVVKYHLLPLPSPTYIFQNDQSDWEHSLCFDWVEFVFPSHLRTFDKMFLGKIIFYDLVAWTKISKV